MRLEGGVEVFFEKSGINPGICRCCGREMAGIEIIFNQFRNLGKADLMTGGNKSQRGPPDNKEVNQVLIRFKIAP